MDENGHLNSANFRLQKSAVLLNLGDMECPIFYTTEQTLNIHYRVTCLLSHSLSYDLRLQCCPTRACGRFLCMLIKQSICQLQEHLQCI